MQPTQPLNPFNSRQPGYNMCPNAFGVQPTRALNGGAKPTSRI